MDDRVLIIGAGPVGSITALALLQAGIPVTILELLAETPTAHRAATTHSSTLDALQTVGIADAVVRQGLVARYFQYRHRETNEIFAEFDFERLKGETDHPFAVQLEQHKTIAIALARDAAFADFALHRQHTAVALAQDDGGVNLVTETPDGARHDWRGRYLIGCDGGRSFARKASGIDFPGFTWEEKFMIVATLFDFEAADRFRYRNYIADAQRWSSVFKIPGPDGKGMWRTLFPIMAGETDQDVTSDQWIHDRFAEILPYAKDTQVVHRNLYNVHQRVAKSFRAGRVFLAGDAAHVNNPLGGMGMNSGIQDGLTLAAKIVKVWRGEGDDALFDVYDLQRRSLAEKYVQAQSIQNKETLQNSDKAAAMKRFDELRRIAEDPVRHKAFLMNASLINMARESAALG